jgi:hypothetical protein
MLSGSELTTAIAAVLFGAVATGFLLHWLWVHLNRPTSSDSIRLNKMAVRLHEAELARVEAEEAKERVEGLWARQEADIAELAAVRLELETMSDGLGHARQRIFDLEAEIES